MTASRSVGVACGWGGGLVARQLQRAHKQALPANMAAQKLQRKLQATYKETHRNSDTPAHQKIQNSS